MSCSCPDHSPLPTVRFKRTATRRDILRFALSGAGIVALGPLCRRLPEAYGAPLNDTVFVVINMDGGCDTLNSVIPDGLSNYASRRPTIGIPNASSLSLNGTSLYRLHPQLDNFRALFNAGKAAFVQKVGYPSANLSHFESQDIIAHGVRGTFAPLGISESGWIARYAQNYAPTPMGAVSIGMGRPTAFVGGTSNPLQVGNLSGFAFGVDGAFPNNHAYRQQQITQILANASTAGTPGEVREALDQAHQLSGQVQTALASYNTYLSGTGVVYPNSSIARNLKDVAALIYGGFGTRVFYTGLSGFDTHGGEGAATGAHATLMQRLDDAIAAFQADMTAMVQWSNVVIAVYTEFGRRNYENASGGTDHAESYSMMLAGGAVNGGLYGSDITNADLAGETVPYATDFRDVWKEIINDHLGGNPGPVFPETQPINQTLGVV